jgi:hypothetical protein
MRETLNAIAVCVIAVSLAVFVFASITGII